MPFRFLPKAALRWEIDSPPPPTSQKNLYYTLGASNMAPVGTVAPATWFLESGFVFCSARLLIDQWRFDWLCRYLKILLWQQLPSQDENFQHGAEGKAQRLVWLAPISFCNHFVTASTVLCQNSKGGHKVKKAGDPSYT